MKKLIYIMLSLCCLVFYSCGVHFIGQTRITEGCRSFSYPDVQ